MILKYDIEISNNKINERIKQLINLIYKLLPLREEKEDWLTPLATIREEISGMLSLMPEEYHDIIFSLLCKLEGLTILTEEKDFSDFRRVVFESLNLMSKVKDHVSNG